METKEEKLERIIVDSSEIINAQWRKAFTKAESLPDKEKEAVFLRGSNIAWYDHEKWAYRELFIRKDIAAAKQHFFTCGLLSVYKLCRQGTALTEYGFFHLAYTLFSDSVPLLRWFAQAGLADISARLKKKKVTIIHAILSLMQDDAAMFSEVIKIVETSGLKKEPVLAPDVRFLKACAKADVPEMKTAIEELLKPAMLRKRNRHQMFMGEFLSVPATLYIRIALSKGYPLEIIHPMTPAALSGSVVQEGYHIDYDFLKDFSDLSPEPLQVVKL